MGNDVLFRKCASIERCLARIEEEYVGKENQLETNFLIQDSVMLNLLRACELSIDAAMHVVRARKLGMPGDARQAFQTLIDTGILSPDLGTHLMHMVGFRNTAIHTYQEININIVRSILDHHLDDFRALVSLLIKLS